jgi:hypothetical protein
MNTPTHKCDACDWQGTGDELGILDDPHERVAPGEYHPAGACPECGALVECTDADILAAGNVPNARAKLEAWQTAHAQAMQHAADLKRTLAWALQRIDECNRGEYWDRARALVDDGTPTVPPPLLPAARAALLLLEDPDADEFQANKVTAQLRAALRFTP